MANPKGNPQNLIPGNMRSQDEARKNGRKGGFASGRKRRHQKDLREAVIAVQSVILPMKDGGEGKTVAEAIAAAVALKAAKGNLKAASLFWDFLYGRNAQMEDTGAVGIPRLKIDIEVPKSAENVAVEPEASCGG